MIQDAKNIQALPIWQPDPGFASFFFFDAWFYVLDVI